MDLDAHSQDLDAQDESSASTKLSHEAFNKRTKRKLLLQVSWFTIRMENFATKINN